MKRWKRYPLLLMLLITGILITGAGYLGDRSIYSAYSRTNGWMTPEVSKVFQGWKDGVYPWDLADKRAERVFVHGKGDVAAVGENEVDDIEEAEDGGAGHGGQNGAGSPGHTALEESGTESSDFGNEASGNSVSADDISGKSVSGNGISGNGISGNGISANSVSAGSMAGNGTDGTVSGNGMMEGIPTEGPGPGVSGNGTDSKDGTFTISATGEVYDEFGRLVGRKQTESDVQPAGTENGQGAAEGTAQGENASQAETEPSGTDHPAGAADGQEEGGEGKGLNLGELAAQGMGLGKDGEDTWEPGPVEEAYFNDALFIGDSRTVGLSEYGGFQEETTFYAATSLTIYNLFDSPKKFAQTLDGRKATLEEALSERQFGKIYLMLGINEMGRGTTESFFKVYADAVNRIRVLQPKAVIFIQGIMRVSGGKSSTDPVFSNGRINERNQALAAMADGKDIFYLEVNDAVCDENGDLITEYTYDQIHLKAKYYKLWKDYLFAHGVVK